MVFTFGMHDIYIQGVINKDYQPRMNIGNTFSVDKEYEDMMNSKKIERQKIFGNLNTNNNTNTFKYGTIDNYILHTKQKNTITKHSE